MAYNLNRHGQSQSKVEKELRQKLSNVEKELQRVKRTSTFRTSSFLQAWDEDMFVAPVADVWLKTTDGTSAPLAAHRCVLASKSPVFKAMLFNDMREKKTGLVEIADIAPEVLKVLVSFFYKGDVEEEFLVRKVQPLLEAAIKYDIKALRETCIDYIIHHKIPTAPYKDGELDQLMCLLELALKYDLQEVKSVVARNLTSRGPAIGIHQLKRFLRCDRFLRLKKTDPLGALEICECIIRHVASVKEESRYTYTSDLEGSSDEFSI